MKQLFISLILTIISLQAFAQIKYESGYFINNEGIRTDCLIKNIGNRRHYHLSRGRGSTNSYHFYHPPPSTPPLITTRTGSFLQKVGCLPPHLYLGTYLKSSIWWG